MTSSTTAPTIDAGTRFAFAPYPMPIEGGLYCVYVVFESSRCDLFCVRTQLITTSLEAADDMCDALNSQVDLDRDQWKCFAAAVFAFAEMANEEAAAETDTDADGRPIAPCDPDEFW